MKQNWTEKRDTLENQIKACKEFLASQEVIQKKAMERGLILTKPGDIKAAMRTADFARQAAVDKGIEFHKFYFRVYTINSWEWQNPY